MNNAAKTHRKLQKNTKISSRFQALIIIVIIAAIGSYLLISSHAAAPVVSLEPENGSKSVGISTTSDNAASGGKFITFTNNPSAASECSSLFVNSYFCKTVLNNEILPNSAAMVQSFVDTYHRYYGAVALNNGSYGIPIYRVGASQATSQVIFDTNYAGCKGSGSFTAMSVPVPDGTTGAGGRDGAAIFYQVSTGKAWEIWRFHTISSGLYGGCAGAAISPATSNGVFPRGGSQLSASGISYLATDITQTDVQSGAIHHAIPFAMPVCAAGYVIPARSTDCGGPGVVKQGNYFRFPQGTDCTTGANGQAMTHIGSMICKAIISYGMVNLDFAGSLGIGAEAPVGWKLSGGVGDPVTSAMDGKPGYAAIANLPWSKLEGIAPPSLP